MITSLPRRFVKGIGFDQCSYKITNEYSTVNIFDRDSGTGYDVIE
jgi:hypothetical protein